jgi:hypothetical protein
MKKLLFFLLTLMVNLLVGGVLSALVGLSPLVGGVVLAGVSLASPLLGLFSDTSGVLYAGIFTEVWTGEMIKAFRTSIEATGWINKIRSYDQYANNDVIHFVDLGGDPEVLLNNYTYPLAVQTITDADKAISLEKYETKPTRITDDELHAISYDKMGSIIERHRDVINEKKYSRALWNLAPAAHTAGATPVLKTTGANSASGTRKMLLRSDLVLLKEQFDKMNVPTQGRVIVLCSDHVNDLLLNEQKFAEQYYNYTSGKIANMYGFEVYEYNDTPYYTISTLARVAYGAVPVAANDRQASVAFYAPRMMRATGSTNAYLSEARDNPTTKENLVSFTNHFICLPLKNQAIAALVSDKPAS